MCHWIAFFRVTIAAVPSARRNCNCSSPEFCTQTPPFTENLPATMTDKWWGPLVRWVVARWGVAPFVCRRRRIDKISNRQVEKSDIGPRDPRNVAYRGPGPRNPLLPMAYSRCCRDSTLSYGCVSENSKFIECKCWLNNILPGTRPSSQVQSHFPPFSRNRSRSWGTNRNRNRNRNRNWDWDWDHTDSGLG